MKLFIAIASFTCIPVQSMQHPVALKEIRFEYNMKNLGDIACNQVVAYDQNYPPKEIGWCLYQLDEDGAYIETLDVLKSYQNQGLGTQLFLRTLSVIKKCGAEKVKLYALESIPFYSRFGFKLCEKPRKKSAVMQLIFKSTNPKACLQHYYRRKEALNSLLTIDCENKKSN